MWRWADVREDVKMSRCEDEKMWEKMWRWADVKMRRCERRSKDEQMWRWADVREDVKRSRCKDDQMWRWADVREDVKMSRCEDEKMWEKIWRWADVKMSRCERRCEDKQMWRWEDVREEVKMRRCWLSRCGDEQMFRRCEDEKMFYEKMFYRPPLLEEPCAQTLSGKKSKKKENADARKGRKVAKHCLFPMAPEGRKVGGCGASWPEEKWKIARPCGAKRIPKSKC